jgi:hypothetical protein
MTQAKKLLALVFVAAAAYVFLYGTPGDDSNGKPDEERIEISSDLEQKLRKGFEDNSTDARLWAGMLEGMARYIRADGLTAQPKLKTMFDVQRLRDAVVSAPIDAAGGGDVIGNTLAAPLAALGTSNEPLAEANRRERLYELFLGCSQYLKTL